jgi:hypothetical protein
MKKKNILGWMGLLREKINRSSSSTFDSDPNGKTIVVHIGFYLVLILNLLWNCSLKKEKDSSNFNYLLAVLANQTNSANNLATTVVLGQLTDELGNTLANATLTISSSVSSSIKTLVDSKVTTNSTGNFRLNIKIGTYTIKVTKSDGTDFGSFTLGLTSISGTPTVTLPTGSKLGVINIIAAEIITGSSTVKICADFPEKWGNPGGTSVTCSVSGLVLTCIDNNGATIKYTYPSIEAAKVSVLDPFFTSLGGIPSGGNRVSKIEISFNSTTINFSLDTLNRVSKVTVGNTSYSYSSYDKYGFPTFVSNDSITWTYSSGQKPVRVEYGPNKYGYDSKGYGTTYVIQNSSGTLTNSGTVQMCVEK